MFSILSLSIYYETQWDIRVKRYCCLNLLRASVFNLKRLDILRDSTGHSSVLIYYGNQSDIRVKTYWRSNLLRVSFFSLKRLDILRHSVGHLSKNLLSFEFSKDSVFNL